MPLLASLAACESDPQTDAGVDGGEDAGVSSGEGGSETGVGSSTPSANEDSAGEASDQTTPSGSDGSSGQESGSESGSQADSNDADSGDEGEETGDASAGSEGGTPDDSGSADDDGDDDSGGDETADDDPWTPVHLPPSVAPPGDLAVDEVPMFVSFGWDDNAYVDAMLWFADHVRDMKNPDGSKVRSTFFLTAGYAEDKLVTDGGQTAADVLDAWRLLYDDGHEIGNHTWSHDHGRGKDTAWWTEQIDSATRLFIDDLDIHPSRLYGFRTPYLNSLTLIGDQGVAFG